jgi:hypothetical protein
MERTDGGVSAVRALPGEAILVRASVWVYAKSVPIRLAVIEIVRGWLLDVSRGVLRAKRRTDLLCRPWPLRLFQS